MAGAGYKLFNSGDVLTAAQVNTYLMEQTVMVFNDAAARTTALSGVLAEGMISYLKDTNATEVYNGSAWVGITGDGDITGVTAGTGISGGGTTGTVTITNDMATTITASGDIIVGTGSGTYDNLPIGTTGQVLTADTTVSPYKVKWAAAAASSPLTTKGDLYTYDTGNARLGVGANGETLVADSSATTGLRWQGDWNSGKNAIINGDFRWNQRRFSSTTTHNTFGFDRWRMAASGGTATYSAQTFTPGSAPVAGYEAINFARLVTASQSAASDYATLEHRIESVRTFAGSTVTVSFWAKAGSGTPKVAVEFEQNFGTGGSPSSAANTYAGQVTLSTSWARYSFTVAIPSISGKTIGTTHDGNLGLYLWTSAGSNYNARTGSLGTQNATIDFWGVQVENGSVATPFTTASGTIGGELALCQRYFSKTGSQAEAPGTASNIGINGINVGTTLVVGIPPFKVSMRVQPTITLYSTATGASGQIRSGGADIAASAADVNENQIGYISATGLTGGSNSVIWFTASAEF